MKKSAILLIATALVFIGLLPASFALARDTARRTPTMVPDLVTIGAAENAYFAAHGKYFQVLFDNQLPSYEAGTLADYVDPKAVPPNTAIDVYEGPAGRGYAVRWTIPATPREEGSINSVGYGPEALGHTFTYIIPAISRTVASTTPTQRTGRGSR